MSRVNVLVCHFYTIYIPFSTAALLDRNVNLSKQNGTQMNKFYHVAFYEK